MILRDRVSLLAAPFNTITVASMLARCDGSGSSIERGTDGIAA